MAFHGYCFDREGWHTPAVKLADEKAALQYCLLQHQMHYEIRITTDDDDATVMQVIDHKLTLPPPEEYGRTEPLDMYKAAEFLRQRNNSATS